MAGRRKPIASAIAAAIALLATTTGLTWVASSESVTVVAQPIEIEQQSRPVIDVRSANSAAHAIDARSTDTRAKTTDRPSTATTSSNGTRSLDLNEARPVVNVPTTGPSIANTTAPSPARQVALPPESSPIGTAGEPTVDKTSTAVADRLVSRPDPAQSTPVGAASLDSVPLDSATTTATATEHTAATNTLGGALAAAANQLVANTSTTISEAPSAPATQHHPEPAEQSSSIAADVNALELITLDNPNTPPDPVTLTAPNLAFNEPPLEHASNLNVSRPASPAPVSDRLRAMTRTAISLPETDGDIDFLFEAFDETTDTQSRQPLRLASLALPADPLDRATTRSRSSDSEDDFATSFEDFDLDPDREPPEWNEYVFARGDNVSDLWVSQWSLPNATLYRLLGDRENATILSRLRPGQKIEWKVDDDGYLTDLRVWGLRGSGHEWTRIEDSWDFERVEVHTERDTHHRVIHVELDGSISHTLARVSGLSASAASAITALMDRHIPAVQSNARTGDQISLLVEYETLPGSQTTLETRLLAFRYKGARINLEAARHLDNRFYQPNGEGLLPPFDRRPFAGNHRLSSHFNPRRRHPVTGRVTPHNGTDWAMPVGTPIVAPANGRVTRVENHPYAGRWIEIEHGQGYSTRYLHLSRPLVRVGQSVNRGERIALSGNTGRSTGPHLHYELHVNNRPVDPVRAELPTTDQLAKSELPLFQSIHKELMAQIDATPTNSTIAMRPFASFAD